MPPSGLAILIGAGPTSGAGIARILASPQHGNLAVALLSRTGDAQLASTIAKSCHGGPGILKAFSSDTSESQLTSTFDKIKSWSQTLSTEQKIDELKLKLSIFHIKHSHKVPFEEETAAKYTDSLTTYATGAMVFSQLSLKWMMAQYPAYTEQESPLTKRGTIIFTGTLGALRTNASFAAYGATRASVRMLAQSLAREFTQRGVQVVHTIANGGIIDDVTADNKEEAEKVAMGKKMRAESVGEMYLGLMRQGVDLWIHELDMRPAAEKF